MKISYSVNNLRRLTAVPMIEIRPITIFLGRNSVGKSTFLRSFPLLRQSIDTKSSAPILWYGDYVDFGNYKSAVTNHDTETSIEFRFSIEQYSGHRPVRRSSNSLIRPRKGDPVDFGDVGVTYTIRSQNGKTLLSSITVTSKDLSSEMTIKIDGTGALAKEISIDDRKLSEFTIDFGFFFPPSSLFVEPIPFSKEKEAKNNFVSPHREFCRRLIEKQLSRFADGRIGKNRVSIEALRVSQHPQLNDRILEELSKEASTTTFRRIYSSLNVYPEIKAKIDSYCKLAHFIDILISLNGNLESYFSDMEYIGPARARSERYYRQQELEVSDISPDGRNLPMFLASLDDESLTQLSDWVERAFGFGVSVHKAEGHISINLKRSGKYINVLDTGYGVSQVLPVLTQIWWMQRRDSRRPYPWQDRTFNIRTLLIEQPELHLHPAHQAVLADVFADAVTSSTTSLSLIVETHSESMINRLGDLISNGVLSSEMVQIVIFGDDVNDEDVSKISLSTFDENGTLKNWPFGFFNY